MDMFLEKYLKDKFGEQSIEWAYNLKDACHRFSFDSRIKLFHDMLNGEFIFNLCPRINVYALKLVKLGFGNITRSQKIGEIGQISEWGKNFEKQLIAI